MTVFSGCEHCGFVRTTDGLGPDERGAGRCPDCGRELHWTSRSDARELFSERLTARRNRQLTALVAQQLRAARRGAGPGSGS